MTRQYLINAVAVALVVILSACVSCTSATTYLDIPMPKGVPRVANIKKFEAGALVIDMGDRQIDNTDVSKKCVAGMFNLKVYGYAVRLLHAGVPLNWAIRANKAKDEADFTAQSLRVHPAGKFDSGNGPWGATTAQQNAFKGGPLVVSKEYATAALNVLNTMKSQQSYNGCAKSIVVYRLTKDADIDIRHVLRHKPHVVVSTVSSDRANWGPQADLFDYAGLIQGDINSGHYQLVSDPSAIESMINENTCHTMFTEPHLIFNMQGTASCPRCQAVPKYRNSVFKFISSGGNFAAQCAAVPSYENSLWASQYRPESGKEGAILSRFGIKAFGNSSNEWGGMSSDQALKFPYPDLPAVQFVGPVSGAEPGTVTEWYLLGNGNDEAALFKNNGHSLIENAKTGQAFRDTQQKKPCASCGDTSDNVLPDGRRAFVVTGAKLGTQELGGMVFYLGSHSWFQKAAGGAESASLYNGRRILLNAMLTPSTRPATCSGKGTCSGGGQCPSAPSLGTCQRCVCVDGKEVISNVPSLCGSCETCTAGNCVKDTSLCECGDCMQTIDTGRFDCRRSKRTGNHDNNNNGNGNCTVTITGGVGDGDYTPSHGGSGGSGGGGDGDGGSKNTAAIVGGIVGATVGAFVLVAAAALIGFFVWRLNKRPPRDAGAVGMSDGVGGDARDNPLFESPISTRENALYDDNLINSP